MSKKKKLCNNKILCIRMTKDLAEVIKANAKLARMSVSEYIRRCIRGDPIILHQEIPYDPGRLLEIYAPLADVSGRLNQVARELNAGEKMTNDRWRTVRECIAGIYDIRDKQQELIQSEQQLQNRLKQNLKQLK